MAKKNIYYDRSKEIKELKQLRNKERLIDYVAGMAKQVNQRFYRLEKAGIGINDTAYRYAREETIKDKPRYSTSKNVLNNLSNEDLLKLASNLNDKLMSKTSTVKGIREVTEQRLSRSAETIAEHITEDLAFKELDLIEFRDFLINGGGDLLNSAYYDSFQIIEDWLEWRSKGLSSAEIINVFKEQQEKSQRLKREINLKDINKRFNRLIGNKKARTTAKRAKTSRARARRTARRK